MAARGAAGHGDAPDLVWSAADHLAVTARLLEPDRSDGPLHRAARDADRAGRELGSKVPVSTPAGAGVRLSAAGMWAARGNIRDRRSRDELRLIMASQRLMAATAELRRLQQRTRQCAAADSSSRTLHQAASGRTGWQERKRRQGPEQGRGRRR